MSGTSDPLAVWRGRRVLVTGDTGFKGAWLALLLSELGAEVTGIGLAPECPGCLYLQSGVAQRVDHHQVDIRNTAAVARVIASSRPDAVLHLAAQALVPRGYRDPVGTYDTNVVGTASLLVACEQLEPHSGARPVVLVVTSDKVYANDGSGHPFVESDRLGGCDPYSSSKAAAELVVQSFRQRKPDGPVLATARAGNVLGGGDQAEGRILPDVYRSLASGQPVAVRHPDAIRPWQFVLDPLVGYLRYAAQLLEGTPLPAALNFGPDPTEARPVRDLVSTVLDQWGSGSWIETSERPGPEAQVLVLDASLARRVLGWSPLIDLKQGLDWTTEWYRLSAEGGDCAALAVDQIHRYRELLAA